MQLTRDEFWKQYWFTPMHMVTLVNPKETDYHFMVEMRNFVIKAGAQETMPGTVANVFLSQMTRILAQDDDKMEHLSDFALMKKYYDKLIVNVKNLVPNLDNTPSYLKDVPETMKAETPPWEEPKTTEEQPKKPKAEPKTVEFEYEGNKYKSVTEGDHTSYYFNDQPTSEAIYSKAASML